MKGMLWHPPSTTRYRRCEAEKTWQVNIVSYRCTRTALLLPILHSRVANKIGIEFFELRCILDGRLIWLSDCSTHLDCQFEDQSLAISRGTILALLQTHLYYVQVLIMSASKNMQPERIRLASELWTQGIATEFGYKANPFMPEQMSYASTSGIPICVVLRPDELKQVSTWT